MAHQPGIGLQAGAYAGALDLDDDFAQVRVRVTIVLAHCSAIDLGHGGRSQRSAVKALEGLLHRHAQQAFDMGLHQLPGQRLSLGVQLLQRLRPLGWQKV